MLYWIIIIAVLIKIVKTIPDINLLIVGGSNALIEEIPWQVQVHFIRINICGGSVIRQDRILTAAHCFEGRDYENSPNIFKIRAGTSKRSVGGVLIDAEKIIRHSKFNITTYNYDIAIVKLTKNLTFSSQIQPIALPEQNQEIPFGKNGLVSGFGRLKFGGEFPKILQKVYLPIINPEKCEILYPGISQNLHKFCAGFLDGRQDACNGDSGGPFVVDKVLVGIVSTGINCSVPYAPGIYIAINAFRDWIESI